jgi:hypothetical protein
MNKMSEYCVNKLIQAIAAGLEDRDWSQLEEWLSEESSYTFKHGNPSAFGALNEMEFKELYQLIQNPKFLIEEDFPFKVFLFFESEWLRLSEVQKLAVLKAIEAVYDMLKDSTAWLVIAELLGEYYADANALQALRRLAQTRNEGARSLTAYGLGKLITNASPQVAKQADVILHDLLSDPSAGVREEARQAIARSRR